MSNPAKIFCSPGPAIKSNQRRAKPLAVPAATSGDKDEQTAIQREGENRA